MKTDGEEAEPCIRRLPLFPKAKRSLQRAFSLLLDTLKSHCHHADETLFERVPEGDV